MGTEWQAVLLGPLAALGGALMGMAMLWRKLNEKDSYIIQQAETHGLALQAMIKETNIALNANTQAMVALTNAIQVNTRRGGESNGSR